MSSQFFLALGLIGLVITACGCGGESKIEVSGTVTMDNTPLPDGEIIFHSDDPKIMPATGRIKDGKYKFEVPAGNKKVHITALREVPGKKDPMGTGPLMEQYIPDQYNAKTTLTAEVGKGKTTFDFPLKSKP